MEPRRNKLKLHNGTKKKIVAGNWKLHKSPAEVGEFFAELKKLDLAALNSQLAIFPALVTLSAAVEAARGLAVLIGSQNSSQHLQGAFTGEVSPKVVKQMGAELALVGHSERRVLFGETDQLLAGKVKQAQDSELTVCFCVGETLSEREANLTEKVLAQQLEAGLSLANSKTPIWIAYEPVWAIGTGKIATSGQVRQTHEFIRNLLLKLDFKSAAILYGGSVKAENAKELSQIPNVDGFLVGGASLEASSFFDIAKATVC